jgi:hypothetical protein
MTSVRRKRHLRPRAVTRLVPPHRWSPSSTAPSTGAPNATFEAGPTQVCSTSREPPWCGDRHSLSRPLPAPAVAVALVGSRGSFRRPTPSLPLFRSGAPSAYESLAAPTPSRGQVLPRPPLVPRLGRLSPASDTRSPVGNALDPFASLSGFAPPLGLASSPLAVRARGPRAARRLLQLYRSTSTTPTSPDPAFTVASHRSTGDGAANGVANWVLLAQGFVDRQSDLGTPHLCIRMPRWIYPNPTRALTPPVAHRCSPCLEK